MGLGIPLASDDGVTFNGSPQVDVEEMRVKLNNLLQGKEFSDGLVQSLHDAARVFEMTIKEQSSLSKLPWFATAWLGVDRSAWVKALSYQIMSQRRFERGALTLASAHLKCLRCGLV
ncbi:hypothetical protein CFOL_v3_33535 [Cephalotus follicularis]|uniref:Uncharacterized protein n=1 Tax=Cephalotus follicularis TaxID=3775 RepID=A0A1Q3DC55_CEPFO|nr:hypothetical protein CFOL_v3_33535 [Cephalotus follicularis]